MTLARRLWWLLAALLVLGATAPAVAPVARAAAQAPQGQYAATLRFEIDSVTPALVTDTTSTLVISGRMVNTGTEELTGVVARWQRGEAFTTTAAVQADIVEAGQPESVLTVFSPVADTIVAGGTVPFTLQTDAFARARSGLAITAPGVYPVMVNVNAAFASGPENGARVGELHTLLTVASVPGGIAVVGTRQSVSMLMPLVDRPHRDPTGAFFDDDLTPLIIAGGRLDDVLSAAEAPGLPTGAVTLAVDPELLEELQLMGAGYTVGPDVFDITGGAATGTPADTTTAGTSTTGPSAPSPTTGATTTGPATGDPTTGGPTTGGPASAGTTPEDATAGTSTTSSVVPPESASTPSTPDPSTGNSTAAPVPGPSAVPGTGTAAALDFLARLQDLAATTPVLVLPYTDIDAVAAVRSGHPEQVTAAVERGRALARDILGPAAQLVENVSWPIDGLVDPATSSVLRSAGLTTAVLDRTGVADAAGDRATIASASGDVTAVLASSSVPSSAVDLNHFTALAGQRFFSGETAATVIAPARSWQPDLAEYASMITLMSTLDAAGLVGGVQVNRVDNTGNPVAATLAYPEAAAARELPSSLFGRVQELSRALASTQQAFDPLPTDDPATAAPTDLFAAVQDGLARQAAGGFRADPGAANRSNGAVDAVIASVQGGVVVIPSNLTLTSATSPLLMTIRNDLPYTVHVRIQIDSADALRAGLTVNDVGVVSVPALRRPQIPLPAETIRAGSSTLEVKLTTPDGAAWGDVAKLQLRSTAIGSFTVVLVIAAGVIVVLTTAIRIRKRYKQRLARIAAGLQ